MFLNKQPQELQAQSQNANVFNNKEIIKSYLAKRFDQDRQRAGGRPAVAARPWRRSALGNVLGEDNLAKDPLHRLFDQRDPLGHEPVGSLCPPRRVGRGRARRCLGDRLAEGVAGHGPFGRSHCD